MSKRPCDFDDSSVAKRAKDAKDVEDAKDVDLNTEDEATKAIRDIVLNVATIGYDFSIVNLIDENPNAWKPHAENVFVNWLRVTLTFGSSTTLAIAWRIVSTLVPGKIRQLRLARARCGSALVA